MTTTSEKTTVGIVASLADKKRTWWVPLVETLVAIVVVAAILSWHWDRKFETNAILVAILPVLFWLLLSGRLTSFKAFGVELSSAIKQVSNQGIREDQTLTSSGTIEFELVEDVAKENVGKIKEYIERRVRALSFELGRRNYYAGDVIEKYLNELCPYQFFKWIVFKSPGGRFAGLMPAQNLRAFGASHDPEKGIVRLLKESRIKVSMISRDLLDTNRH